MCAGITSYNCDPHTVAMDYRYVGFRECAAEVARYLVAVEGMDLQDPLRMRMLSHLQCYSAQREAAAKTSTLQSVPAPPPSWPPAPAAMAPMHSFNPPQYHPAMMHPGGGQNSAAPQPPPDTMTSLAPSSTSSVLNAFADTRHHLGGGDGGGGGGAGSLGGVLGGGGLGGGLGGLHPHSRPGGPATAMTATSSTAGHPPAMSPPLLHSLPQFHATQFPTQPPLMTPSSHPAYSQVPHHHHHHHHAQSSSLQQSASVKPYRPWGGELAY
ncbi:hypothetical protein ACOMHN_064331 [Nucella lapillus]